MFFASVGLYVRTYHMHNIMLCPVQLQYLAAFGGLQAKLQQIKVVVCCLDDEHLVGSCKDLFLWCTANTWSCTTKLPSQRFHCTCTAFYQFLQDTYCSIVNLL